MKRMWSQVKRHLDILLPLAGAIFTAGAVYTQNVDAMAAISGRIDKHDTALQEHGTKIEKLSEIKGDLSAIREKQDLMWELMRGRK